LVNGEVDGYYKEYYENGNLKIIIGNKHEYFHVDKNDCFFDHKGKIDIQVDDVELDEHYKKYFKPKDTPSTSAKTSQS